jgi:hypothetical protein
VRPRRTTATSGLERDVASDDEVILVMRFVTARSPIARALCVVSAVIVYGCGSATDVDTRSPCTEAAPLRAHVAPLDPSVSVGNRVQLSVFLKCGAGGPTVPTAWTWKSSSPDVISVDAGGLVTGVSRGTATVTATSVRFPVAAASVAVRVVAFSSFVPTIQPPSVVLTSGGRAQFRATVSEEPNAPVVWSIDHPEIATVDPTGLVEVPRCGVAGGAVVTARHATDPTWSVSAALTVVYAPRALITIQSVRDSVTDESVDFNHVRGTVVITIRAIFNGWLSECVGVTGLEVVLGSPSGDSIVVPAGLPVFPEATTDLYFNTAARLPTGQRQTPNGNYSFRARAFDREHNLVVETATMVVTLENP